MIRLSKKLWSLLKKYFFKYQWRKANRNNQTVATNKFNSDIVKVGRMSYGPIEVYSWNAANEKLTIGNYVSIASGVKFILGGNHYYSSFSTYPFKVKLGFAESEAYSNGPIVVDDDAWIGMDSIIMSGVKIGRGSVIAAGSVVVKDVMPYSIVGGNPAKLIKMRFCNSYIESVSKIDYSKLNHEVIKENIELFYTVLDEKTIDTIMNLIN